MQYNYFETHDENREEWESLCKPGEYCIVSPELIPGPLPIGLTQKFESVLLTASGVPDSDAVFYMLNGQRVDARAGEIDQQPFGFYFTGSVASPSGCLVQHGDWTDRSSEPPSQFWDHMAASGVGNCYPLPEMPDSPTGRLGELRTSQTSAFEVVIAELKRSLYRKASGRE